MKGRQGMCGEIISLTEHNETDREESCSPRSVFFYSLFSANKPVDLGTHVTSPETVVYIYHRDPFRTGIQHGQKG